MYYNSPKRPQIGPLLWFLSGILISMDSSESAWSYNYPFFQFWGLGSPQYLSIVSVKTAIRTENSSLDKLPTCDLSPNKHTLGDTGIVLPSHVLIFLQIFLQKDSVGMYLFLSGISNMNLINPSHGIWLVSKDSRGLF